MGKLNIKAAVNSARLGIIANQFGFATGCFVYHLNELRVEYFKLQTSFPAKTITKYTLAGTD